MTKFQKITQYIQQQCLNATKQKLASELTLAKKFNCSRATVANALHALAKNGFIYSRPGAGWFISQDRQSAFLKSVSQTIDFDDKKITILKNLPLGVEDNFKNGIDHFLKIEYYKAQKVVALLLLMIRKWEIIHLDLTKIKQSTNKLYQNKVISSIEYEVLLQKPSMLACLGNYPQLNAPILKFSVFGNVDNLISTGYILESKSNFNFKIRRNWI